MNTGHDGAGFVSFRVLRRHSLSSLISSLRGIWIGVERVVNPEGRMYHSSFIIYNS